MSWNPGKLAKLHPLNVYKRAAHKAQNPMTNSLPNCLLPIDIAGGTARNHRCRWSVLIAVMSVFLACSPASAEHAAAPDQDSSTTSTPSSAKRLSVDRRVFDFGRIVSRADLRHIFRVRNVSSSEVVIREVRPDCRVLSPESFPRQLAPGESGDIVVSVRLNEVAGRFDCLAHVHLEGDAAPELSLQLTGRLEPTLRLTPPRVTFKNIRSDVPQVRIARITSMFPLARPPQAAPLPPGSPITCDIIEMKPGTEYVAWINTVPPLDASGLEQTIKISTGLAEEPTLDIPVSISLEDGLHVAPKVIYVDPPTAGQADAPPPAEKRLLQLAGNNARPVKLTSVGCADASVKVTSEEIIPGSLYRIEVLLPAGYRAPNSGAEIRLNTDHPTTPTMTVAIQERSQPPKESPKDKPAAKKPAALALEGKPIPEFRLETLVPGRDISKEEVAYWPVTVLNFVAPNCGFCKKQLPKVEQMRLKYESMGVRFVNVSQTMRKPFTPTQAVQEYTSAGSNLEVAIDAGNLVGKQFNATSYPTLFIVTSDQVVQQVVVGAKPNIDAMLDSKLDAIINGRKGASAGK